MMKHRRTLTSIAVVLLLVPAFVVNSPARITADPFADSSHVLPFEPSEKLVYEGEFTRALLRGINIADLNFSFSYAPPTATRDEREKPKATLRFTAEAVSKGIVSKLFGLNFRQRVESIVEPLTFSVLNTTKLDEQGKRKRTSEAVFDHATGKVVFTELDPNDLSRPPRILTSQVNGRVLDIASAFYYVRTLKLEPGMSFEILISDTGQIYRTPIRVIKRERLKTSLGSLYTLRVVPELFGEGRLIRGNGEITIWFTDDARHIPVRARINNSLGRLDIKLKSLTNGKR